jgi:hypothetical protein
LTATALAVLRKHLPEDVPAVEVDVSLADGEPWGPWPPAPEIAGTAMPGHCAMAVTSVPLL